MPLFNYTKPGPGISKNDGYPVSRFALYFQLLGRKFWNICVLSLVMVLFTVPYGLAAYGLFTLLGNVPAVAGAGLHLLLAISGLPFMFYGPVLGAAFKVARDFANEEPVFLFSDFWDALRHNVGKPIAVSCITYFFSVALTYALPSYFFSPGIGIYVFFPLCLIAALMLLFMQFYAYTMAVCFDLSLKDVLKNALILSFLCIGRNLLLLAVMVFILILIGAAVVLGFSYPVVFGWLVIAAICFLPAFHTFTVAFVIHAALQKYIVEPYYRANPQKTSSALRLHGQENGEEAAPKELPEYVYHNGRMVHRSVLERESVFDDARLIGPDNNDASRDR